MQILTTAMCGRRDGAGMNNICAVNNNYRMCGRHDEGNMSKAWAVNNNNGKCGSYDAEI